MSFGKIWSYSGNFRVQRALALADINGLDVQVVPDFQMGVTNKSEDFLSKFPLGKAPAFESADGKFFLTEGQAIGRYIAESGPKADQLLGADPQTRAKIEEWACFSEAELANNIIPPLLMVMAKMIPYDEAKYNQSAAALERALKRVEVALKGGKKFLVGDQFTFADAMVLGPLHLAGKFLLDEEMRKAAPSVEGYLKGLLEAVPEMKKQFGDIVLAETRTRA
ncbi:glutathione S-transferase [Podospora australis]|uniref:Glutathione S-transferase n=1 Tax=Podospora australis TaxID=1536484 RepID=A0AAN6WST8_9PEZI|nr:glutathione S-transferase [Podospora australis]